MGKGDLIEWSFMVGGIVGAVLAFGVAFDNPPDTNKVKVFQRENHPAVMRFYRLGRDVLYVEDSNNTFIPLNSYLNKIPDKSNRRIEEEQIKKATEWYK